MNLTRPRNVFLLAVAVGASVVAAAFGVSKWQRGQAVPAHPLAPGIAISQQLQPDEIGRAHV